MPGKQPPPVPLAELKPGQKADFFAALREKTAGRTRDGKPFYACKFRDARRTVALMVWADGPFYAECDKLWQVGHYYKIRGTYQEHERYGPQVDAVQVREVGDDDRKAGFDEADFVEHSRFGVEQMWAELRDLITEHVADEPLQNVTLGLLDDHGEALKKLPASPTHYFPFAGGWLEHTLSVTRNCARLVEYYRQQYPDLRPPLNKDLVVAAAALHEIGRAAELGTVEPYEATVPGRLFGHTQLGRDLVRDAGRDAGLGEELLGLLEHLILTHLRLPEWGSPRLPLIPEALILHHADDLDAKLEMYARRLDRDTADGPFTERDPVLGKALLKGRSV